MLPVISIFLMNCIYEQLICVWLSHVNDCIYKADNGCLALKMYYDL